MTETGQVEIVTVFHNLRNKRQAVDLRDAVSMFEPDVEVHFVDNTKINRGFAKACNLGAAWCTAPVIGFLNPDVVLSGAFVKPVMKAFADENVVIAGERFGKSDRELRIWECRDWVCGAAMFVRADWFEQQGGFDERFVMYFEEADLIKRAEQDGRVVRSIKLPIVHESPAEEDSQDVAFKRKHFDRSARLFEEKWGNRSLTHRGIR